jgi:2-dehydropantoate 2-reductase
MKLCIYGAGAIGGFLGAKLALAGEDVTLVARGPHLKAMQERGVKLLMEGRERIVHPSCTGEDSLPGPQDVVVVTLKAHSVRGALAGISSLLGPKTVVVWAVNGIPWWYFHGLEGPWKDHRLASLDPDGAQWETLGPGRIIGCVVYPAVEVTEPGVIRHIDGDRFTLGEPSGEKTDRVRRLANTLIGAGLRAPVRSIRDEIWGKLWGNLSFNPISALTLATLDQVVSDPGTSEVVRAMMAEAQTIGEALGVRFSVGMENRIAGAAAVGGHRTSMLQDLEKGRPMEIDALIGAVSEIADLVGVKAPTINTILALLRLRARVGGMEGRNASPR